MPPEVGIFWRTAGVSRLVQDKLAGLRRPFAFFRRHTEATAFELEFI